MITFLLGLAAGVVLTLVGGLIWLVATFSDAFWN